MAIRQALYRGFSSYEFEKNKTYSLTDIELVKLDLLNHIFTKKGERVMMPLYGTNIPYLTFEPLDDDLIATIESELRDVFLSDPRVKILELEAFPIYDQNAVFVQAKLRYVELNTVDLFEFNIALN